MSRFQAMTNPILEEELEELRKTLGLRPDQKADLLRELTALASWVVRQAGQGRAIEAREGRRVEPLVHPVVERLRRSYRQEHGLAARVELDDAEIRRLAEVLDAGFSPTPELRAALARLAQPEPLPPRLKWRRNA